MLPDRTQFVLRSLVLFGGFGLSHPGVKSEVLATVTATIFGAFVIPASAQESRPFSVISWISAVPDSKSYLDSMLHLPRNILHPGIAPELPGREILSRILKRPNR